VAPADNDLLYKAKRRKLFDYDACNKLGMMRYVIVVLDATSSMEDKDLRPDRFTCSKAILDKFIDEFFDQNPLSQLSLHVMRDGKSFKISDLSGNGRVHKVALQQYKLVSGECSLQNALELAMRSLRHIPHHASREVIIIHSSMRSCDPSNIFNTIEEFSKQNIRCSIIGVSAHIRLCQLICDRTAGVYRVILDELHYRDVLMEHCRPPLAKSGSVTTLIKMGFPQHTTQGSLSCCMCHLDTLSTVGYTCPQCSSKYCELPVECTSCGLTLVLAPHLARSYHHLFPLPMYTEVVPPNGSNCSGCLISLGDEAYSCPKCQRLYCIDCDLYCHEILHNCPSCESLTIRDSS
jgi:transcription initiation factor TFIIH subunit 2